MFVNYVRDSVRDSAFNIAAARVILGLYLLWKVLSRDWTAISSWPVYPLFDEYYALLVPPPVFEYLWLEQWIAAAALVSFIVGYRTVLSGFVAALLTAHLGVVLTMVNTTFVAKSFYKPATFILFYLVYREQDALSVDAIRRTANRSLDDLNDHLRSDRLPKRQLTALAVMLVVLSFSYFVGGLDKMNRGPVFEWITAQNMQRFVLYENVEHHQSNVFASLIRNVDWLAWLLGIGTIVLEVGFFLAVIAGVAIWPFVLGLAGLHTGIALSINPFFFDQYLLYALFLPWDRWYARVASDRPIDLVYDRHCYFCARSLYVFKELDVNGSVRFHSQYDVPEELRNRPDVDFEDAMYVFRDGEAYSGYRAFRELLRQYRVFFVAVWVMERRSVERLGERVYEYVATNRSRHFTCRIDPVEETQD